MALSTDQYGYLIDPLVPITDDKGTTIKDGFLRVFIAGSSTPVITYRNYDGSANEQTIELDNSGRCKYPVIVSKSLAYKVVVYDAQHSQETPIITVDKLFAIGASVTAATVVQGLDNVEGESDGFVKASVTGTTATVKLDATNVSHELTSDAAVGYAANAGYMVPALSNDSEDPGDPQKLPLAWIWGNRLNAVHTKTEISDFADENDGFLVDSNAGPKFMKWKTLANKVLGFIKSLSTTITAFRTGDVIPVDGPSGTAKMAKDDLLKETADNALAGNVLSAFIDTKNYIQGDIVVYNGVVYQFKSDHTAGAWNPSQVINTTKIYNYISRFLTPFKIIYGAYIDSGVERPIASRATSGFIFGNAKVTFDIGIIVKHYYAWDLNLHFLGEITAGADKTNKYWRVVVAKSDGTNFSGNETVFSSVTDSVKVAYDFASEANANFNTPIVKNATGITWSHNDYNVSNGSIIAGYGRIYSSSLISNLESIAVHDFDPDCGLKIYKVLKYMSDGTFVHGMEVSTSSLIVVDGDEYLYRLIFSTSSEDYRMDNTYLAYMDIAVAKHYIGAEIINRVMLETDLENDTTRAYLDNVDYIYGQITDSVIADYKSEKTSFEKEHPRPIKIVSSGISGATSINVYSDPFLTLVKSVAIVGDGVEIFNLIPRRTYYYEILNLSNSVLFKGRFRTTGRRRMIRCKSTHNIRDIGGIDLFVRYGRVYRGSRWSSALTAGEKSEMLDVIGISAELDFRNDDEANYATHSDLSNDIPYYRHGPGDFSTGVGATNADLADVISKMAEWLASGYNIYCHCASGCDRTGLVFFVLGALLGVPEQKLATDYELSSFSGSNRTIEDDSGSAHYAYGVQIINAKPGSTLKDKVETWLLASGVTSNEIATIRKHLSTNYA